MPCCVMLCCEECPAMDVHCVLRCVILLLYQYIYYTPLHVSSTVVLIFRRTIALVQHLVSSLSLGDCSVHRLREDSFILIRLLHSSTCFDHYYAHLQEDNCISTASGIVTVFTWLFSTQTTRGLVYFNTFITLLYMFRALLCSSSGGQLY